MPAMRLARFPPARALLGQVFAHMSFALPVHRLRETATLLAFNHPQPSYPVHSTLEMVQHYARVAQMDVEQAHRKASPADNWHL